MKSSFRPLVLTAMAFGLAASAVAQDAPPAPAPNPEESQPAPPVETPAPAPVETPPAAPAGARLMELDGLAAERLGLTEGAAALVRPDQYVAARWKSGDLVLQADELSDARWFDPADLPKIPPPGSMAYRLIRGPI